MKQLFINHYKNLFALQNTNFTWEKSKLTHPQVENDIMEKLGNDVTDDDVKRVVFCMNPCKDPRPDDFPAGFYQEPWNAVGINVCEFIKKTFQNPSELSLINQKDICLITKVNQLEHVNYFRSIYLWNMLYKIVSKIIMERLKSIIPKLVSPFQYGFVAGRNIHENIIVSQEILHCMNNLIGRKGYFMIKADQSKAYAKLSWDFIWRTMVEIKLPMKIINIIMHGVTSLETNIKWNGTNSKYFWPSRGIRKGDPVSPYLFVFMPIQALTSYILSCG